MKSYKQFLTEYLTDEQRAWYADVHMTDKARAATDHFFGAGNDHVREDVIGMEPEKSEIHKAVERHLGKEISHSEYASNSTRTDKGNPIRLGRLIRDDKLRDQFANDRIRVGSKKSSSHYMTIVRGTEVAGQTNSAPDPQHPKGHSWGNDSCKNVDTGSNRHYLHDEIKHGTVVVRAHDQTGQEIYRATLQPHHNVSGQTAYALDSEYGLKHPAFTAHAHDVARRLSGKYHGGSDHDSMIFRKHVDVYNDNGNYEMLHPGLSSHELHGIFDSKLGVRISSIAAQHPNADSALLTKALLHNNARVQAAAAANPNASVEHLHHALDSNNFNVRLAASKNPNIKPEHVDKILYTNDPDTIAHIVKHPSFQQHHFDQLMNSSNSAHIVDALSSRHVRAQDLDKALKHTNYAIKMKVARHQRATPEHLDQLLEPGNDIGIMRAAAENKNASEANLLKALKHTDRLSINVAEAAAENESANSNVLHAALKHEEPGIRAAAVANFNAANDHIETGLNDSSAFVRVAAAESSKARSDQISRALHDHVWTVRAAAARNPNATSEHLHKAMGDPESAVRAAAAHNPNATEEHLIKAINSHGYDNRFIRVGAAKHPNATKAIIEKGLADEDEHVVNAAQRNPNFRKIMGYDPKNFKKPGNVYTDAADLYNDHPY